MIINSVLKIIFYSIPIVLILFIIELFMTLNY